MRTAVSATSLAAYDSIKASGKQSTQAMRVLEYIGRHPFSSRNDIAEGTGLRLASVCGRVDELLEDEVIEERGIKADPISGHTVKTLKVRPAQRKLELVVPGE